MIASIFRSGPFKIALVFASVVTLTTYVVFGLVYLQFYSSNILFVRKILQDEAVKAEKAPLEQIKQQLELRLTQDLRHLDYVGLYDKHGSLTFGNVASDLSIPVDGNTHLVVTRSPLPADRSLEKAIFVATRRPDGGMLVLGRSLVFVEQLEDSILRGSAIAVIPVVLLALLTGAIVSLRASRRLSQIQRAINRVMHGELHVRLPARGKSDDIDELVVAVNQMLDEIVRLLQQLKSVGDNIAHDLRAPLSVMRARLERGLAGDSQEQLRALTASALGDLERAMTTVTALLRISELESGLRRSAFDFVDLVLVCRDAFDLYEPLAEAKGLAISLQAPAPVVVTGDGDLLREALANLIDNAIKFTPRGGRVEISCGQGSLLKVVDTGPGVPAQEREKIVKRFYRSNDTRHMPGVGLGLSMATTIIELHGFRLSIRDNAPGSIFEVVPGHEPTRNDDPGPPAPAAIRAIDTAAASAKSKTLTGKVAAQRRSLKANLVVRRRMAR